MSRVASLERIVLGPLSDRPVGDWQRAPAGKWTPAQIVEHLALSLELSARGFEAAQGARARRPRTSLERLSGWFVFRLGWTPPGIRAPRRTTPAGQVEAADAGRHFREGLRRWLVLESRPAVERDAAVYVQHPRLGELDFEEWLRFHEWHCRHHARQIRGRLAG
jgi:hypothetical protein